MFYIEPRLGEGQFDTALIQVGINDLLNSTSGTDVFLQNILKIAARCKIHGINKIFVSSVLTTHEVSSDLMAKLNLDISNICKSNRFHFIDNSNISMNFLYKTHIPSKNTPELEEISLSEKNKKLSEMESFRNIRKKYFKNPLMGILA